MAINWSTLSPQTPPGGVVAQLPQRPANNSLNSLANGIMGGIQQGQSIMLNNQSMKQNDQQLQLGAMKLQEAKQQQQDSQSLRAAAAQGEMQYGQTLLKSDPVKYYSFQKGKADYQEVLSNIAFNNSKTKTNNSSVIENTAITFGRMADAAHQTQQTVTAQKGPEAGLQAGQQVFTMMTSQLDPGTQKDMVKNGLDKWNDNTNVILHSGALNAMADQQAANEKKNATNSQKNAEAISKFETKEKAGTINTEEQRQLDILRNNNAAQNARGNPIDTSLANVDAQRLKAVQDVADKAPQISSKVDTALEILNRPGMESKVGPIIDMTKLNQLSPDVQELGSVLNDLALTAKGLSGMPSNTFSEADRNFVAKIAGTTSFNMKSLRATLDRMKNINMKQAVIQAYKIEDGIRKQSSGYKEWKTQNPSPDLSPFDTKSKDTQPQGTTANPTTNNDPLGIR